MKKLIAICLICIAITGCVSSKQNQSAVQQLNSITILPFISPSQPANTPDIEQESGLRALTTILHEKFTDHNNVNFISANEVVSLIWELPGKPALWAKKIGESRKSDAVLAVGLIRYEEREGGKYSVDKPASVGFDFRLVSTKNGDTMCFGRFDKTQKTLTDNMLEIGKSFERGFKWLTAEQLLREGIQDSFSDCSILAQ